MVTKDSGRSRPGQACRYWLMAVSGVALAVVAGVHTAGRDRPEKTGRSTITPAEEDDAPDAKVIDKDQLIDVDTFDQQDSPLWPLIQELRSTGPHSAPSPADRAGSISCR